MFLLLALLLGEPFFDAKNRPSEYAGPDRELPEAQVAEVLLGYFGPSDPADADGGDAWIAAQMAIDEANRGGGHQGKLFRLVPAWSDQPWKSGAAQVARLAYRDRVWAIVGGPDGATTHLAEQVAAKARLPLISPTSTDRSAHLASVPWVFSVLPGDHLIAPLVADELIRVGAVDNAAILMAEDHDARQFVFELQQAFKTRRVQPRFVFAAGGEHADGKAAIAQTISVRPAAVIVAADSRKSAEWVKSLRQGGYAGRIFGSATMGQRSFSEVGPAAADCVFPQLYAPAEDRVFAPAFERRRGHLPDYAAAATYDSVRLLVAAVRQSGLNRARLGDAIRQLSPWSGVTGEIRWDGLGSNTRQPRLR